MRILLVDDHPEVLESLTGFLRGLGHEVVTADDGRAAMQRISSETLDLVLTDLRMPGCDGIGLLVACEALDEPPPVALMTAFGDTGTAVEAMRLGAIDYLRKPIDVRELHGLVERVSGEIRRAPGEPLPAHLIGPQADGLVVAGAAFAQVVELADRLHAAPGLSCVIEAETGCGKELIARRIHHGGIAGDRRPFVALNCAAIAQGLFEAELFGYAAGAFTGAQAGGSEGKLALAADGTLFLDEIAELPLEQQAKLLRVLEERTWYPVGSNRQQRMRARVVCATNRPLAELVSSGRFREDLLYRLKVGHLRIPPLRERREEIVPLARALLPAVRRRVGRGFVSLAGGAENLLAAQPWPGNVRQLQHLLEVLAVTRDGEVLSESILRTTLEPGAATVTSEGQLSADPPARLQLPPDRFDLDRWQGALIAAALERNAGSPVRTASYLGITRKVLYTLRKRYGLLAAGEAETDG